MVAYAGAVLWGTALLASFAGWGDLLLRILTPDLSASRSLRLATGLAFSVLVGGALNAAGVISRTTIVAFVCIGLSAGVVASTRAWSRRRLAEHAPRAGRRDVGIAERGWLGAVILLLIVQVGGSVAVSRAQGSVVSPSFSVYDDFQGYLVFSEKMLQTGSMGRDPFGARRLEASLGGQAFLDAVVLGVLPAQHVQLLDLGVGLLITVALVFGYARERGVSPRWASGIVLGLLLVPPPILNLSAVWTGVALLFALYRTQSVPSSARPVGRAIMVALLAAALCSLKSSFIPVSLLFLAGSAMFALVEARWARTAVAEVALTVALMLAFLAPWMIALHHSSGTLLYPLLGRGYHQSVYGNAVSPGNGLPASTAMALLLKLMSDGPSVALGALVVVFLATRSKALQGREALTSLVVAVVVGRLALFFATGGVGTYRYTWPLMMTAIVALVVELSSTSRVQRSSSLSGGSRWLALAAGLFLVGWSWDSAKYALADSVRSIRQGFTAVPLVPEGDVAGYRRLQEAVPAGATILARLDRPFVLDFARNTIFVVDQPGEASPPPGLPYFKGSEALAEYFAGQAIRYVVYSYGNEALYPRSKFTHYLAPDAPAWPANITRHTFDFQDNLAELGRTRRRIYDDGQHFVLDLEIRQ